MPSVGSKGKLLGDYHIELDRFSNIETTLKTFLGAKFKKLPIHSKFLKINSSLCQLILETSRETFLLGAVTEFISRVNKARLLPILYHINQFEFWLNQFSDLSNQDQQLIRGKITGRYAPREEYQNFFPLGMNKVYPGTHFVAAHLSPDVDTTIASFWGWIDAFSSRVGDNLHIWNLPGGPPTSPVMSLFRNVIGNDVFSNFSSNSGALTLNAIDLVTKENLIKEQPETLINTLDHGYNDKAVILVDAEGNYLGDWRSTDVEVVRQVIILVKSCLHWLENNFHMKLISLFANKELHIKNLRPFLIRVFEIQVRLFDPVKEFSEQQKQYLNDFLIKVLDLSNGIDATVFELARAFAKHGIPGLKDFMKKLEQIKSTDLFDDSGRFTEDRPATFRYLETIFNQLDLAILNTRNYVERLDIVMTIKTKVLQIPLDYLTLNSDIDDIREKIGNRMYMTVVFPEEKGKLFPVGIVWAKDLRKPTLGTVTLRDFCNLEEVKMASYLNVISVIDHHKTSLVTSATPLALIGDAQSCNVLIAEQALLLNERYSHAGISPESLESQITKMKKNKHSKKNARILSRLLQRTFSETASEGFFVHPKREFLEYLSYIYATLDDTDLLTKVSSRDVLCIAKLLNQMKTIVMQEESEVIHFDDIPKDRYFAKNAAKKTLQNEEMYSLYNKIYALREQEVDNLLKVKNEQHLNNLLADTKEQSGCCRIGQTKIFKVNLKRFNQAAKKLQHHWYNIAQDVNKSKPEMDLHIHMISTIASAAEVYSGTTGEYAHRDELWFWAAPQLRGYEHLTLFLHKFKNTPELINNELEMEIVGPNADTLKSIFKENLPQAHIHVIENKQEELPIAILRFKAGTLNSRKSMISPYLPRLIS